MKDNQVENANIHGCIAVRHIYRMTRDQFTVLPLPDEEIKMLVDAMAVKDGITRAATNLIEKRNPGNKGVPDEDGIRMAATDCRRQ